MPTPTSASPGRFIAKFGYRSRLLSTNGSPSVTIPVGPKNKVMVNGEEREVVGLPTKFDLGIKGDAFSLSFNPLEDDVKWELTDPGPRFKKFVATLDEDLPRCTVDKDAIDETVRGITKGDVEATRAISVTRATRATKAT